jgi:uncharacterized protein YrrD
MIRASELSGRPVVDIDAAEKLGRIDKIIIDPEARRVAAFLVSHGGTFHKDKAPILLPAASVHAIGPDAVTVRHPAEVSGAAAHFDQLPRVSDIVGRKVVSRDGRLLGVVDDVLISGADGVIVGYQLGDSSALGAFFGGRKHSRAPYLRADVDLRTGRDLIVAPDDALREWDEQQTEATPPGDNFFRRDHPEPGVAPPTVLP